MSVYNFLKCNGNCVIEIHMATVRRLLCLASRTTVFKKEKHYY